jgi:ComF family protein
MFCFECWRALDFLVDPCCVRCGIPFPYPSHEGAECGACLNEPPAYDRLRAAVAYGAVARQVVLKLKYGRPGIAPTLAAFMVRHLEAGDNEAVLMPVPLHRWRIWKRGYNQSAMLAAALARRSQRRIQLDLLRRIRATPSMRGLGRRERARVVRGAFKVRDEAKALVEGGSFILVDDVYTSGATANACARALKKSGAARVEILCWARVVTSDDH